MSNSVQYFAGFYQYFAGFYTDEMLVAIGLRAVACWPVAQATACSPIATRISYFTARCWLDASQVALHCKTLHIGIVRRQNILFFYSHHDPKYALLHSRIKPGGQTLD